MADTCLARLVDPGLESQPLFRLTIGLREEVAAAIEASEIIEQGAKAGMMAVQMAKAAGQKIRLQSLGLGSFLITDAVIYRQIAPELGRFPPELVRSIVKFYAFVTVGNRIAEMPADPEETLSVILGNGPRIRMTGRMLLRWLEIFESADFSAGAELKMPFSEHQAIAKEVGYPLEQLMKERGLNLPS